MNANPVGSPHGTSLLPSWRIDSPSSSFAVALVCEVTVNADVANTEQVPLREMQGLGSHSLCSRFHQAIDAQLPRRVFLGEDTLSNTYS